MMEMNEEMEERKWWEEERERKAVLTVLFGFWKKQSVPPSLNPHFHVLLHFHDNAIQ